MEKEKHIKKTNIRKSYIRSVLPIYFKFILNGTNCFGMQRSIYYNELRKYLKYYKENEMDIEVYRQINDFVSTSLKLYSDKLVLDEKKESPVLIVVVKNELDRMKLFMKHYRSLGVHQFIVIDNDSVDGTRQFVAKQPNTRVYLVKEPFQTQKKQAWIEKVLAITGYNQWYIVVDSDELIDYIGSEKHSIEELIISQKKKGKLRLQGYMLDMYSRDPLFFHQCSFEEIPKLFCLFDKDSYNEGVPNQVFGGPRSRLFGLNILLSKQSIFYFKSEMLYANSHYIVLPNAKSYEENVFVIKHYKFLRRDKTVYEDHVIKGNYYNNSQKYRIIMDYIDKVRVITGLYEHSIVYETSESLRQLPFLHWTEWGNPSNK